MGQLGPKYVGDEYYNIIMILTNHVYLLVYIVTSDEWIGTTEYLTLYARYLLKRCHYKRVRLYF
jgi:hypothetical protein